MKLKGTLTPIQLMYAEHLRLIWNAKKKELNLTQEKVAQLCEWNTQAAFNAYLLGRMPLNTDAVLRLAKVLQVHPTEIMPELSDILPHSTSENSDQQESLSKSEKMIVNLLRSIWEEKINAITNKNFEDLNLHYKEKQGISNQLVAAYKENTELQVQASLRATEFINLNRELVDKNLEQVKRESEILIINQELSLQYREAEKHAVELELANEKIAVVNEAFQTTNEDLIAEGVEKAKLTSQLLQLKIGLDNLSTGVIIANNDRIVIYVNAAAVILFNNLETEIRYDIPSFSVETLIGSNIDSFHKNPDYQRNLLAKFTSTIDAVMPLGGRIINIKASPILNENGERLGSISEWIDITDAETHKAQLTFQNSEKQKRADELEIANIELAFQNSEKAKRADELELANEQIAVVNEEFKTANEDLIAEGAEKEKIVTQLQMANNNNQKLNQQVNHFQKVESIGRLTAGISHDFNNILSCILGYNEMNNDIRDDMKDDALKSELDNNTKQIANAGQRAVGLIGKMMTYARQNEEREVEIDERLMNAKIHDVLEMLKPMFTSKIQLDFVNDCNCESDPEQDNCAIPLDTTDLHQIITNLTVNARDAMTEVGNNITISLKKVVLSDIHCMACGEMMRGEFIKLAVTDNGSGMEPKIIRRIFDPFFTTKPQGEGTGLGLATTMGLVHSAKGHILVESHLSGPTQGSSFKLLFPILT